MLRVEPILTNEDVIACCDMYIALNDPSFLDLDRDTCIRNMWSRVRLRHFLRCLRDDGGIKAWIYGAPIRHDHANYNVFQQMYYASNQTGVSAARCVRILHEALYDEACKGDYRYVISPGSFYDDTNTFARLLERYGWTRRGYLAVREVVRGEPNAGQP